VNIYGPLKEHLGFEEVLQAAVLAVVLLVLGGLSVKRRVAAGGAVVPDDGVSIRNVFEVVIEGLAGQAKATMGDSWRAYFPVVASIFFFILASNLMGMVPGVGGATTDVNTALAWALISFAVYNFVGIKQHGWKYIYQFMGPALQVREIRGKTYHIRWLAPIFLPLEIVLHGARVLTLTVRLVANMFSDHKVIAVWITMVPIAIPAIFMGLGLIVSVLQAFVFSLLTMIYIGMALEEPH
jgi:F-type H+-transporting ATPase subunit a